MLPMMHSHAASKIKRKCHREGHIICHKVNLALSGNGAFTTAFNRQIQAIKACIMYANVCYKGRMQKEAQMKKRNETHPQKLHSAKMRERETCAKPRERIAQNDYKK